MIIFRNFKLFNLLLLALILIPFTGRSQNYTWTVKANYPGGLTYDPFCFVIGAKAYVGTGRMLPNTNKNDFWEYNPATNMWSQKANFPGTGRYGARGFSINNFGYAGTGWDPTATSDFYRYDPTTNSWNPVSNFGGSARYTSTAFSIGDKGYLGLGYGGCLSDFWQYDPVLDQWTQVASHPNGSRQAAAAVVVGNYAYVAFGLCQFTRYNDLYRYDPVLNSWQVLTSFPAPGRSSVHGFALGDTIYFGMGNNAVNSTAPFNVFEDFWMYDISDDSWQQLPDCPGGPRFAGVSFSIGNKGYVGLGSDTIFNTQYLMDLWEYAPAATGISEFSSYESSINIYPVPANNFIYIEVPLEIGNNIYQIQCFDKAGRELILHETSKVKNSHCFDVSGLSQGIYVVQISDGKKIARGRFVVM